MWALQLHHTLQAFHQLTLSKDFPLIACGLHSLRHTGLAMPPQALPCIKQVWRNLMLSLLFLSPFSSLAELPQGIGFSVLSYSQSILNGNFCPERPTYLIEP